ncbi:glycosyltransferase [Parathermosynechococcus lividus]
MVARWDPQKDHQNLVAAMGLLANRGVGFRALLVGTGVTNAQPELQATLTGHGLGKRVRLLGPRSDIPAVMLALDVHVLSSSYGEAFPNVLAEAMTCERPCVVTDVGDSARIVGSSGEVVPPRNPEVLAAGLVRLLDRLGHEPDLGHRARQRVVAEFSVERMLERTEQVLLGGL